MNSRFEVPSFAAITNPPEWVRTAPPPDVPNGAVGIEVLSEEPHLHIVRNEDESRLHRYWTVRVYIRTTRRAFCTLSSRTDYRDEDTPEAVQAQYALDIASYIASLFEEQLA